MTLSYIMSLNATASRMIQVLAGVVLSMHVTPLNLSIIMYICSRRLSSLHCCITNNRMILNSYSEREDSL